MAYLYQTSWSLHLLWVARGVQRSSCGDIVVTPESNSPSKVRTFFRPLIEKTFVKHVKLSGVAGQDEQPNNAELPAATPNGHFNSDPCLLRPRIANTTVNMKTLADPQDTASSSISHYY